MNLRNGILAAAAVAAVAVTSTVTAAAEPVVTVPSPAVAVAPTHFRAAVHDNSVVTTIDRGTFTVDRTGASVSIRDLSGREIASTPLWFALDGHRHAIRAQISADGRTLRLTPDIANGWVRPVADPIASPLENQLAMNDLINAVSFGTTVGSLVGTVVGAVVGVGAGLAVSAASCAVISIGCVLVVLPTVTLGGAVGGLVGLGLGGAPGLIVGLWNYYTTMTAPPGHSPYADQIPALNQPAPHRAASK